METNQPYPTDVAQHIHAFVDSIERVLIERAVTRTERNTICDEVESQIQTMIERRVEAGAELNLELVRSIIESMDSAESYARSTELGPSAPVAESIERKAEPLERPTQWKARLGKKQIQDLVPEFISRQFGGATRTDFFAVVGLATSILGCLFLPFGMSRRHESISVFGLFLLFVGTIASGIAFWRIRNSNGRLQGHRLASIGILVMPLLFLNAVLAAVLIAGRVGLVIGVIAVVAGVLYGNYRLIRFTLTWLETSSLGETPVEESFSKTDAEVPVEPKSSDGHDLTGLAALS
jgi:hypothetical protein